MATVDKVFIGAFIVILVMLGVLASRMQKPPAMSMVMLGGVTLEVEIADTDEERHIGLSNRDSLSPNKGMLFVFEVEGEWSFWMKDTRIPLDIMWADSNGTIITIAKNVRPESYPAVFTPDSPARYVLEVNAGFADEHNIAEGMKLTF